MPEEEAFVLIVGGGPVGLSLAIDLGRSGVPAILVSQNLETSQHPKCNYSNTRTMEHFRRLGIADEVRAASTYGKYRGAVAYRTSFCGFEIGRLDLDFLRAAQWPGPEHPTQISQVALEPVLKRNAEAEPSIDVRFGWRLVALDALAAPVIATIEHVETGERRVIRARFLVGCDGSRSLVRDAIGAQMVGEDGTAQRSFVNGTMMAFFFRSEGLFERSGFAPATMTWIISHAARGWVMSQNGADRFIAHYAVPADRDWRDISAEDVLAQMLGPDVPFELLSAGPWTGGLALVADTYRKGNCFVAGDAAHLYTPLGGFGMNTGIGDAMNLGWKLAAICHGWGGEQLLETYEHERRPIGQRNSRIGVHCARRKEKWVIPADVSADTPQAEAGRRALGAHLVVDDRDEYATIGVQLGERYSSSVIAPDATVAALPDPWDEYVPHGVPGARAPHFLLEDGTSAYDLLASGFMLCRFGTATGTALEDAARQRGLPLRLATAPTRPEGYAHDLALVRPDGHIAWVGDAPPSDPLALIDLVRGAIPPECAATASKLEALH